MQALPNTGWPSLYACHIGTSASLQSISVSQVNDEARTLHQSCRYQCPKPPYFAHVLFFSKDKHNERAGAAFVR